MSATGPSGHAIKLREFVNLIMRVFLAAPVGLFVGAYLAGIRENTR